MPVYLALQLAGCAAPPVAGRTGGLLPRLFTLAAPAEGRAVVFCHTCPDVAAGFPLGNAMLFVARTFLFMLAHRATDLISVFCKVTEIFPDVQIGRANSDTFDGENVGLIHASVFCLLYLFLSIFKTLFSPFLFSVVGFCPICRQPRPGFLPGCSGRSRRRDGNWRHVPSGGW